jgi:hypothetical protein
MNRDQLLDLYFVDARAKLVDIAALLDRVERTGEPSDYRLAAFQLALGELSAATAETGSSRAERVLLALSDPTTEPIERAPMQGATGAPRPTP